MGRPISLPYRILASLLYAEFDWLERSPPLIVVPVNAFSKQLQTTPREFKKALEHLQLGGFISFNWYSHYTNITINPPVGMCINRGRAIEINQTTA